MSSTVAASDTSWMPVMGKHNVNLGLSLRSALRTGGQPAPPSKKRSALPSRDFYSVRYRFKPPSLDTTKPGYMNITPRTEDIAATVEHPCAQSTDVHTYVGTELASKDVDCVLIYDEETMTFTLEKLDSSVSLTYDKKGPATLIRPTASSEAATPPVPQEITPRELSPEPERIPLPSSSPARAASVADDLELELEAALCGTPEVEEIPMPVVVPEPRPAQRAQSRSKVARPGQRPKAQPAPAPAPVQSQPSLDDLDDEIFEASSRVTKRPRVSPEPERKPPQADSGGLALPGPSTAVHYPSSYPGISLPTPSAPPPLPPPPPAPISIADDSDSEEDWDQVAAVPNEPMSSQRREEPVEEEELDMGAFMDEVNEQIGEHEHVDSEDDFLAAAVDAEPESPMLQRQPLSLDEMANRAGGVEDLDEDFSSSDESDDE